jgi:hypothetical protein
MKTLSWIVIAVLALFLCLLTLPVYLLAGPTRWLVVVLKEAAKERGRGWLLAAVPVALVLWPVLLAVRGVQYLWQVPPAVADAVLDGKSN